MRIYWLNLVLNVEAETDEEQCFLIAAVESLQALQKLNLRVDPLSPERPFCQRVHDKHKKRPPVLGEESL